MAEQKQSAPKRLPKNIRQIGTSTGSTRIYLEDYVYTYLHTQEEQEEWTRRGFVLLGRIEGGRDDSRYFISGMIRIKDTFFNHDIMEFDDEAWAFIFQEMKKYYDDLEIVGWGQDVSNAPAGLTAELERVHKQNFNVHKNVLFLLDQVEKEEAFYVFEKNMLQRREGYYVYYEKNPQMQEYMIENHKKQELNVSVDEPKDPLAGRYREVMLNKKEQAAARKWNGVLYTTSMLLVLSVCVLGVSAVNNVEKLQNLELAVSRITGQADDAGAVPALSSQAQKESAGSKGPLEDTVLSDNGDETKIDDELLMQEQDTSASGDESLKTDGSEKSGQADETKEDKTAAGKKTDTKKASDADSSSKKAADSEKTDTLTEAQSYLLQGYYIVKKGDSLVSISKKIYGTPKKAQKICDLNGIEDMDKIYAGQKLQLP